MAGAGMKSLSINRRTAVEAAEVDDKRIERLAVKDQIAALQLTIDSITAATTLGDLRGYVKDVARTLKRVARILT